LIVDEFFLIFKRIKNKRWQNRSKKFKSNRQDKIV